MTHLETGSQAEDAKGDRPPFSPILTTRFSQAFWTLTPVEMVRLKPFGDAVRFSKGEVLFRAGTRPPGMFVILSGRVSVSQRDGLNNVTPIVEQGPGDFIAEVGQLSGSSALVDVVADDPVEALLIRPDRLRALVIAEAALGERITQALMLRRASLLEASAGGPVLIGRRGSKAVVKLQGFLTRNAQPHQLLDPDEDIDARAFIERIGVGPDELPIAICPAGAILLDPSEADLARSLGMGGTEREDLLYDAAVVGAGPAGLATAVYGASEGLSMVVLDRRAFGGQAGASARIENYFGFPTGISGQALTSRAYVQAMKFGAKMVIPASVENLEWAGADGAFQLSIDDGSTIRCKTVIIASGADYRRPDIPGLAAFEGRGVWFWASALEARMCAGLDIVLVGGGNSAGQAAVFLADSAKSVRMLIRGPSLSETMSKYLVDRIANTPNIMLMPTTELTGLFGDEEHGLVRVEWKCRGSESTSSETIRHVFLFVGGDPATKWLVDAGVALDQYGFVLTGERAGASRGALESSQPGVFAVGDVRSGSVKRVGAAIGEGAQVVAALHEYLARRTAKNGV